MAPTGSSSPGDVFFHIVLVHALTSFFPRASTQGEHSLLVGLRRNSKTAFIYGSFLFLTYFCSPQASKHQSHSRDSGERAGIRLQKPCVPVCVRLNIQPSTPIFIITMCSTSSIPRRSAVSLPRVRKPILSPQSDFL